MLRSSLKSLLVLLCVALFGFSSLKSQPAFRAQERLGEFKKMRLLEILDLDENTSSKFLAKYNAAEKAIQEKHKEVQDALLDLEYLLRKKASKDEISKQSQKLMDAQKALANTMFEQQKEIKSVLNEEQFARYLIFEHRFRERLQKAIIERAKGKGNKNGMDRRKGKFGPPDEGFGPPDGDFDGGNVK